MDEEPTTDKLAPVSFLAEKSIRDALKKARKALGHSTRASFVRASMIEVLTAKGFLPDQNGGSRTQTD